MTTDIKKTLVKEVEELSADALQEVLDFVEFLKIKRWRETGQDVSSQRNVTVSCLSSAPQNTRFTGVASAFSHQSIREEPDHK